MKRVASLSLLSFSWLPALLASACSGSSAPAGDPLSASQPLLMRAVDWQSTTDRVGQVAALAELADEVAIFSDVDQNEFVAAIEPGLYFVNVGFTDALLGVFDNLQKARWMLLSHNRRFPTHE